MRELLTAVRRLINLAQLRELAPTNAHVGGLFAAAWRDAVALRGGDSRGLERLVSEWAPRVRARDSRDVSARTLRRAKRDAADRQAAAAIKQMLAAMGPANDTTKGAA